MILPPPCLTVGLRHWRWNSSPGRHRPYTLPHLGKRLNGLSSDHITFVRPHQSVASSIKHNLDGPVHLSQLLTVSFLLLVHSSYLLSDVSLLDADRRVPSVIRSRLCRGAVLNLSRVLARQVLALGWFFFVLQFVGHYAFTLVHATSLAVLLPKVCYS